MTSKATLSRAVLRGTAVAMAIVAGIASTTLAVAQGGDSTPPAPVVSSATLTTQLASAQNKAQVVALLNTAADNGLSKDDILQALRAAQRQTTNMPVIMVLVQIEALVNYEIMTNGGTGTVRFADNGGATASTFFVAGNNAASGGVIDTSFIGGGFDDVAFNIRVGPYMF